jgi:hypothetical protein
MPNHPCYPAPPGYYYNQVGQLVPIGTVGYGTDFDPVKPPDVDHMYWLQTDHDTAPPGYYHNISGRMEPTRKTVSFGNAFSAAQLASTGVLSYVIVRALGASLPGAIAMGIGNVLWEAGSPGIPAGWKRYVLGLFRKPGS